MTVHQIEKIKYDGCMNSIETALLEKGNVLAVEIYKEENKVCVTGIAIKRENLFSQRLPLGYHEKDNNSLLSKAGSFLGCAVGNM